MGVDIERERRGVGRGEREPELDGTPPIRGEVGAGDTQTVGAGCRQGHLDVAEAGCKARCRPDPLAVDAEPDTVEQLDGRCPDTAHFASGVEAHGRVASLFGTQVVGTVSSGNVASIGEIA